MCVNDKDCDAVECELRMTRCRLELNQLFSSNPQTVIDISGYVQIQVGL